MTPEHAIMPLPSSSDREKAVFRIAQISMAGRIGSAINAEAMKELIRFRADGEHVALGYKRFVDFLELSELSPMTKHQYYERKSVFEKENSLVWDQLTDIGIPIAIRKRLPQGTFEVQDDKIVIHGDEGDQTLSLDAANRTQVIQAVKLLHKSLVEKQTQLEKGKEDYRKLKERFVEGDAEKRVMPVVTAADKAHMAVCGSLVTLIDCIAALDRDATETYAEGSFLFLARQYQRLNEVIANNLGVSMTEGYDDLDDLNALI